MEDLEHAEEIHRGGSFLLRRICPPALAPAVIKTVSPQAKEPTWAASRLRHEYHLLQQLDVPGVSRVLDWTEPAEGESPSLRLADAGPRTLAAWTGGRPIAIDAFLRLALRLCEVVVRVHARGIIHRDIQPANIVIDEEGRPTLVDFDLATHQERAPDQERMETEVWRALPYRSPEQLGRLDRPVNERSDLYALGVVLYELLAGTPPFTSADPAELVHAHVAQKPVPPHRIVPSAPAALSEIVLRLLAKMPEHRYPSAKVLLADLREANAQWEKGGSIEPFPLGLGALEEVLPLPQGLFGRESERATLERAFTRAARGGREVVVLVGPEGVGKTALALSLKPVVAAHAGRFASGKIELGASNRPFPALGAALSGLLQEILADAPQTVAQTQQRVRAAVGEDGVTLLPLLPELGLFLEPGTPSRAGSAAERGARFQSAFVSLVGALSSAAHPLVLFVDDLHRADSASLDLMKRLAEAPALSHFALLGTWRTEGGSSPDKLGFAPSITVTRLDVPPLSPEAVNAFLSETFHCPPQDAASLVELLHKRTGGNPLFLRRMIRDLQQRGAMAFDPTRRRWVPDYRKLQTLPVSETVADQMAETLGRLPPDTRRALAAGAAIGARFRLDLLGEALGEPAPRVAEALRHAVRQGHLQSPDGPETSLSARHFQFAHDRIQQAALGLLAEAERAELHLCIGRALLPAVRPDCPDERVFLSADQIRLGIAKLEENEHHGVASLFLEAGRRAKALCAWRPGLAYLEGGLDLLTEALWSSQPELAFELHREAIECAFAVGEHALGENLALRALARGPTLQRQMEIHRLRIMDRMVRKDFPAAVACGIQTLAELGVDLNPPDLQAAIASGLAEVERLLGDRPIESFENAPAMTSPRLLAAMQLLTDLGVPTFMSRPDLWPLLDIWRTRLTLEHGVAPVSAEGLISEAMLWHRLGRDPARVKALGHLGLALAHRLGDPAIICRAVALFASALSPWVEPADTQIPHLRQAQLAGLRAGERLFGAGCSLNVVVLSFFRGAELKLLLGEIEEGLTITERFQMPMIARGLLELRSLIHRLMDSEAALEDVDRSSASTLAAGAILRLQLAFLLRDLPAARAHAATAEPLLSALTRASSRADYNFYRALSLAASSDGASEHDRAQWLEEIRTERDQFETWAHTCPENHRHRHLLLDAETLRLEGRPLEAAERYEEAINAATEARFLQDAATASELAGRYHLGAGRKRLATHHLRAAVEGFLRWGARAKAEALQEEHGTLIAPLESPERAGSDTASGTELDLVTLFRAAEAISAEVTDSQLLGRILQTCLSTAGAERGALLLLEEGQLVVRVFGEIGRSAVLYREPLERFSDIPRMVVDHVRATEAPVAVADAAKHPELSRHPAVAARGLRSVLGLPITLRGRFMGVLYLENNLATRVFGPDRVRLLQLLSSQVASTIENSRLFASLNSEIGERTRAEARIRFLADAGEALAGSLDLPATLQKLANLSVPSLADWCVIDLVQEGGIRRVASAHRETGKMSLFGELQTARGEPHDFFHVTEVLKSRRPLLFSDVSPSDLERYVSDDRRVEVIRRLGAKSGMVLPLFSGERPLGALTLVSTRLDRRFETRDLELAQDLARRASIALENAQLYGEAQAAIQLRDDFLSIASHELNTPLANLALMVDGLSSGLLDDTSGASSRAVEVIARQTRRLKRLVDDLLDVAQIRSHRLKLRPEEVDLVQVVDDAVELVQEALRRSKCEIFWKQRTPVVGRWDRGRLEQIATNLLSNAAKFGRGKPIELTVRASETEAELEVLDHGIGIPTDRLPHVFERFERGVSASNFGGLGLGLYIVREISTVMGGKVDVQTSPNSGSRFTVKLPRHPPPP